MPWQEMGVGGGEAELVDEDGFEIHPMKDLANLHVLQEECWRKFVDNPQINSHVRDYMGSMTGFGFNITSDIQKIQDILDLIIEDPRNALYHQLTKYAARAEIEGELFLCVTAHLDGFIEVDFMDPALLKGGGDDNSGIYFHPRKKTFPLMYRFEMPNSSGISDFELIPSINIAYFPEMYAELRGIQGYSAKNEANSRARGRKFKKIGGFRRFIVAWDKGFLTKRNVSHIKTTIVWLNHYENLKKWEIDHKKSSGSYLWVAMIEDIKAYRTWLKLTPEQKKDTGLYAKKTPGGTLVLPPGIKLECVNPKLPSISETDTDILHMVTSGLNKPEDMVTGVSKGSTFAGVKETRGPHADRTKDQTAYFERFLRWDLFRAIFTLHSAMTGFPLKFKVKEVVDFKNKEPVMKNVVKPPWKLIDIEFPVSEVSDVESRARAYLGVKHPSVVETLGIPREEVARKLGFSGYKKKRLRYATEEEVFPDLPLSADLEAIQEGSQEPTRTVPSENKSDDGS